MSLLPAFDCSEFQQALGNVSAYRLGIARASWAENEDPKYADHIASITGSTIPGAYHAGYDLNGATQAAFFLSVVAKASVQPKLLAIDTREFGMSVSECNAFLSYVKAHDKRPVGVYDSEGNWTGPYVAHDFDWVANTSAMPSRPFLVWQNANHGGPGGGDHDLVDPVALDRLLGGTVARKAPLWTIGPLSAQVNVPTGKVIYQLDGRTRYSITTSAETFKAPGLAPGWTMILDGATYAAVRNADLAKGS